MSQREPHPVKPMCAVLAALSLGVAAMAASARQQDLPQGAPPQGAEVDRPAGDAPPPEDAPGGAPAEAAPAPAAPAAPADAGAAKEDAALVEPVLAERLYEMAQAALRQENVTEPTWRQAAALLRAASRLSPKDPRFPRLLVEARIKVGDTAGTIDALAAYRRIAPGDRVAQIQLIDLYARQIQTADGRLGYLRDLLERETTPPIPPEVKSHVAAQCAHLLLERSQEEAAAMVEESLRLFPLNPDALRLRYEMLPADAAPPARAAALLAMLRSNPGQPDVVNELARMLGDLGLHGESVNWYTTAMGLYPRAARPFPAGFVADAGAQVLLSGKGDQLEGLLAQYLKARPDDAEAWFLKLVRDKAAAPTGKLDRKATEEAYNALARNLGEVTRAVAGGGAGATPGESGTGTGAGAAAPGGAGTTAPPPAAPATAADAMAAARRIKAGEAADLQPALVSALTDLAWLELYFGEDAAASANWVNVLREILPADSVTLARLDGWVDLVAGRGEQARAKLAPVADRDPLSAVGAVKAAPQDAGGQAEAAERAAALLSTYRSGLVGALVWSSLRDRNIKPPESEHAADVRAELEKFPRDWMEIVHQPEAFYEVMADVGRVAHRYRDPMFGRITIRNKTDFDLTIGPEGVIRPDLWFDAKMVGLVNRSFPGVAYDRITGHVVLPARGVIQQGVRIDQGALDEVLEQNPSASAQINANVLTNPVPLQSGIGPGPAGQRRGFNKSFVRSGFSLSQTAMRKRLNAAIQSGAPGEKIRGLDLLAGYLRLFARQKDVDPATQSLGNEFMTTIAASRNDASEPVALWARYLTARLATEREAALDALVADEAWLGRLLALLAAADLGAERQMELASRLAGQDADPTVKEFAAATVDVLRSRPATQPTAGAGAGGADGPAGGAGRASPGQPAAQPPGGSPIPGFLEPAGGRTGPSVPSDAPVDRLGR